MTTKEKNACLENQKFVDLIGGVIMASIAAIKIAQQEAGLNDTQYRQILYRVAGVGSCTLLDAAQSRLVLSEIRKKIRKPAQEKSPSEKKIWALWYDLRRHLPEVERSSEYLIGFAIKANGGHDQCQVTRLDQLSARQAQRLIEALKMRILEEKITGGEYNHSLK